ncbi:MAG: SAM-dependent methyltransferase [Ruminococcaceae bacterium]|nr:SAM-dependent methyltransferase [Oscillospiraceae bacterium]
MTDISISSRLFWFAERVREGVLFADIGTDHAKLPVYLVKSGKVEKAIASDIGEGPIARAKTFISINNLTDKIKTYIGDGIAHLDITSPADIAICGMGGETIIGIIKGAPFVKQHGIRLLLQPMTDFAAVRKYLAQNGFVALDEDIVFSDGKMYQCIVAEYTGKEYALTDIEAELGKVCIEKRSKTFIEYVNNRICVMKRRIESKEKAGHDITEEITFLKAYKEILEG